MQTPQSHRCSHEWHPKIVSITITNCRQTHDTERNSHTTITRHQEDKLSKAASSLSLSSPSRWWQNKNGLKAISHTHRNRTEKIKCLKPYERFNMRRNRTETECRIENVHEFDFIFFGFGGRISANTTGNFDKIHVRCK